jgi:hypothetical protein
MRSTILGLLRANQAESFRRFLQSYRARKLDDVNVPTSPEEALKLGYELGYQQGYGNGLKEGVDLGVDVGMGAAVTSATPVTDTGFVM